MARDVQQASAAAWRAAVPTRAREAQDEPQERTGFLRWLLGPGTAERPADAPRPAPGARAGLPRPSAAPQTMEELRASVAPGTRMTADGARRLAAQAQEIQRIEGERERAARPVDVRDLDSAMTARAQGFNQALRRELTDDEWNRLSSLQRQQVLLNNDLVRAYDADVANDPVNRGNTKGVISQLGLRPELESRIVDKLGVGIGPAVRYSDLFNPDGTAITPVTTPARYGGPTPSTVARPTSARQNLINSIAANLEGYLAQSAGAQVERQLAEAEAAKDSFTFQNPQAKADYEFSFDFLLDKNSLSQMTWAQARQNLAAAGYDPEDFKRYVRDRIQLYPVDASRSSQQDIDAWFGTE